MSFLDELKRRNVFRVGIAYGVAAWVLLQIVDLVLDNVEAPDWVMDVFMMMVVLGFIVSLVIAWAIIGNNDKTLEIADQLVGEFGIWEFYYFVQDPIFEGLRGEPRYKALALEYDRWLETVQL